VLDLTPRFPRASTSATGREWSASDTDSDSVRTLSMASATAQRSPGYKWAYVRKKMVGHAPMPRQQRKRAHLAAALDRFSRGSRLCRLPAHRRWSTLRAQTIVYPEGRRVADDEQIGG
jgi:hypothetical protein